MTERTCPFESRRDDLLVAYLYDELEAPEREQFASHLAACADCRNEVAALRGVRAHLASWAPPQISLQSSVFSRQSDDGRQSDDTRRSEDGRRSGGDPRSTVVAGPPRWWQQVPVWAQVAAAMLVFGASLGIANLNVHYDRSGLTVNTGWLQSAPPSQAEKTETTVSPAAAPWREDLAALEKQLRTEFHESQATAVPARSAAADAEIIRRVRALLDESEKRQQRDLNLRVAEVLRDVENERRADLVRISQSIGQVQNNTGVEQLKQRQLLNYLVRVSSQK